MKKAILGAILALLVAGSLGIGFLAGFSTRQTTTTTTMTSTTMTIPTNSSFYPFSLISAQPVHNLQYNSSYGGYLAFNLTVRNVANSPVYYEDLCGSSLSLGVIPSSAVKVVRSPYPLKSCPVAPKAIPPGASESILSPVNSQYVLEIVQRGTLLANLTLGWNWTDQAPSQATTFLVSFSQIESLP